MPARLALVVAFLGLIGLSALAEDKLPTEEGFSTLFTGTDLAGWKPSKDSKSDLTGKTEIHEGRFKLANGILTVGDSKDRKEITTASNYNRGFTLALEYRAEAKASIGVLIRGIAVYAKDYPDPKARPAKYKPGDWNEMEVQVVGGYSTTKVNNKEIADSDTLNISVQNGRMVATLNGKPLDISQLAIGPSGRATVRVNGEVVESDKKVGGVGPIGFQTDSGKVEVRRVRIKEEPK